MDWIDFAGMPALIFALLVVSLISRQIFHKPVAHIPAVITVLVAAGYVGFDLVPRFVSPLLEGVRVESVPATFYAVDEDGRETEVRVRLYRGDRLIDERRIAEPAKPGTRTAARAAGPVALRPTDGGGFVVVSDDKAVGTLSRDALEEVGLSPARGGPSAVDGNGGRLPAPLLFVSDHVLVGEIEPLGRTMDGPVGLEFLRVDDAGAEVTLLAPGLPPPEPRSVVVPNKDVRVQTFGGDYEFYIGVRAANFVAEKPWAAFTVFVPPSGSRAREKTGSDRASNGE